MTKFQATDSSDAAYAEALTPKGAVAEDGDGQFAEATPEAKAEPVPLSKLFSFADRIDVALMAIGTIGALAAGLAQPLQLILWGDALTAFNPSEPISDDDFRDSINKVALKLAIVGFAVVFCGILQVAAWSIAASRQAKRIRSEYVQAILSKEIGWFDVNEPMQLATRVAESTVMIQDGMGRKVGDGLNFFSMATSAIVIGLVKGWELALVLLVFTPVIAVCGFLSIRALARATQEGIDAYAQAGAVAQESLANIRTVHMFNAIEHFVEKYKTALKTSTQAGIKKGFAVGWGTGLMFFSIFCTFATGMYFGAVMIANDRRDGCVGSGCYDGGRVMTVFLAVVNGAMALGQAGPSAQAVMTARTAARDVFDLIDRASEIDPLTESGVKLDKVIGHIQLENVTFAYPSRPEVIVCNKYSLTINAGETVALVGPSGSGKSTVVSLLERFYDPLSGLLKIDGVDVRDLNVQWLRQQVGLVGQEPVLFATSIMENIRSGKPSASDAEVVQAAKMANAYDFIQTFPSGFATDVGERGAQLSGGQKQRIAIARAIIKDPPILLLDEATSALDTESERIVQASLDKLLAHGKRTTVIVAHRMSTIRNADKIAVHSDGSIVELGSHDELMEIENGHYRRLIETQSRKMTEAGGNDEPAHAESNELSPTTISSPVEHPTAKRETEDSASSEEPVEPVSLGRVWKQSLPEWKFLVFGAFGAVINAATFPVWGVLLAQVTVAFFEVKPRDDYLDTARGWSLGFVALGVVFGSSMVLQNYSFAVVAQRLVARIRLAAYSAMLHQEVGWFDLETNTSGALVSRLATDSATLQAMTSDMLNAVLVNVTTLAISFTISFFYSWEMSLVMIGIFPVLGFVSQMQGQTMNGTMNATKNNDADAVAGSLLSEAIGSIRTVAAFSLEKQLHDKYRALVDSSKAVNIKAAVTGGIAYGLFEGTRICTLSLLFYVGGIWVANDRITFEDMYMVILVTFLGMLPLGMTAQGAQDQNKAKQAASSIFAIIDRTPAIDSTTATGDALAHVNGDIEFRDVAFAYPTRPDAPIYSKYNLRIKAGQTVALVGASGSGKSTAIALLERFYDPAAGRVTLDSHDLRDLSVPWLRDRISLVSQEPVLFTGTIADSIALGKPGAAREEIVEATKKANAFDFINNFPEGLDTNIGDRGAQVSGGQKQRIAIARAILRDPSVLLLDEATSALDNESERVVQASLDELLQQKKCTTIIVAHRLSTIRNADVIAVTKDGAIVEQGSHDQLMALGGVYASLVARQTTSGAV